MFCDNIYNLIEESVCMIEGKNFMNVTDQCDVNFIIRKD